MIQVTRLNKKTFVLNCEWIESVEATPDTVIVMINGKHFVVTESVDEIVKRVVEYKQAAGFLPKTPYLKGGMADVDPVIHDMDK